MEISRCPLENRDISEFIGAEEGGAAEDANFMFCMEVCGMAWDAVVDRHEARNEAYDITPNVDEHADICEDAHSEGTQRFSTEIAMSGKAGERVIRDVDVYDCGDTYGAKAYEFKCALNN